MLASMRSAYFSPSLFVSRYSLGGNEGNLWNDTETRLFFFSSLLSGLTAECMDFWNKFSAPIQQKIVEHGKMRKKLAYFFYETSLSPLFPNFGSGFFGVGIYRAISGWFG